jgi:N-methylhydantoinase B
METVAPLRVLEKRLMPDSGGRGKHRGGLGQRVAFLNLSSRPLTTSFLAERTKFPATGLFGGGNAPPGGTRIDGKAVDPKATHIVEPGAVIEMTTPGGGGYGDPRQRDAEAIRADVAAGYVTPAAAKRDYAAGPSRAAAAKRPVVSVSRSKKTPARPAPKGKKRT